MTAMNFQRHPKTAAAEVSATAQETVDIEHMPVADDPRMWTPTRKNFVLLLISSGSLIVGLSANIQNPSVKQMEAELPATSSQFSLSISLFILIQGGFPIFWTAISEVKGRRMVYIVSLFIYFVGSILVAISKNIGMVIGFRALQAAGSSAVMSIGAATLADIYDPHERGAKMGVYYIAPLLGPVVGPILGGILTSAFNWRASFWFLVILGGCILIAFSLFFKDTFRKERSLTYQNLLRHCLKVQMTQRRAFQEKDVEKQSQSPEALTELPPVKVTLKDVNPFQPILTVMRRINNVIILISSGVFFAFNFMVVYTSSRTLSTFYGYSPLKIGLVLIAFGIGSISGSVLGGRWSDKELARLKMENDGVSYPEMRLRSTVYALWMFPPCVVGLGWVSQQHVHISAYCVMLFLCGFFSIWTYSSTLAYIVDANVGRSSSAVAMNSFFRGLAAFIGTEIAVPVQDALGDGWFYTIFAFVMIISALLTALVMKKGGEWRERGEARDAKYSFSSTTPTAVSTPAIPRARTPELEVEREREK